MRFIGNDKSMLVFIQGCGKHKGVNKEAVVMRKGEEMGKISGIARVPAQAGRTLGGVYVTVRGLIQDGLELWKS